MTEQPAPTPPPSTTAPPSDPRAMGVRLVAVVNGLLSVTTLAGLLSNAQRPPELAALPGWYWTFAKVNLAVALAASIGLWMKRRWGFGLLVLAYFSSIIALVAMRQSFVCQAAFQFPLLAIASLGWRSLK